MKKLKKKDKRTLLEREIGRLEESMSKIEDQTSVEYQKYQEMLTKLYEIDNSVKTVKEGNRRHLDPNTLLLAAGSLAEIVLIMNHERLYVIATKAMSRVVRAKL